MNEWATNAMGKILSGLLFGIGFSIAGGIAYYYVAQKTLDLMYNDPTAMGEVVITKHEKVNRGGVVTVLGTVENRSDESLRNIALQVDLLKDSRFVDQCDGYMWGTLQAGEARNFKITCGNPRERAVADHDTYAVRIVER